MRMYNFFLSDGQIVVWIQILDHKSKKIHLVRTETLGWNFWTELSKPDPSLPRIVSTDLAYWVPLKSFDLFSGLKKNIILLFTSKLFSGC